MNKPTEEVFEQLYFGEYYDKDYELVFDKQVEVDWVFVHKQLQTQGEYIGDQEVLYVIRNTKTNETWGATFWENSWHEEPLDVEDIFPVASREKTVIEWYEVV